MGRKQLSTALSRDHSSIVKAMIEKVGFPLAPETELYVWQPTFQRGSIIELGWRRRLVGGVMDPQLSLKWTLPVGPPPGSCFVQQDNTTED